VLFSVDRRAGSFDACRKSHITPSMSLRRSRKSCPTALREPRARSGRA
jgi:hypothetical protein